MHRSQVEKLALIVVALMVAGYTWASDLPAGKYSEWTTEKEIFVPMRDGVHLDTDVWLPKGATEKLPTVLVRTPYDKDNLEEQVTDGWAEFFVTHGYAVVVQSERGRYFSQGDFQNILQGAGEDGYDTVEWIVKQPWSNGKVGTSGCSSSSENQPRLAAGNPPGLAALIAVGLGNGVGSIPGSITQGGFYRGGVPLLKAWGDWYAHMAPTERLLLPANSSQEQRIRLRKTYTLNPEDLLTGAELQTLAHLPSRDILRADGGALAAFDKYITWTPADPRWGEVNYINDGMKPRVPALYVEGWHDPAIAQTTYLFKYLQGLGTPNQHLIIAPGPHCSPSYERLVHHFVSTSAHDVAQPWSASAKASEVSKSLDKLDMAHLKVGELDIGDARYQGLDLGYSKLFLNWLDYWLKGDKGALEELPPVQLFIMGKGWVSDKQWPLGSTHFTTYYLTEDSSSSQWAGRGLLSRTESHKPGRASYIYDPSEPTPSLVDDYDSPAPDLRPLEARSDMLVYSTATLTKPLTIAGPIEVVLYVSSSGKDTDFMAKLTDVYSDGTSVKLTDDAFRVRYREGFDKRVLMDRGRVYEIKLTNMATAIRFPAGHRIRLDISSSSFPWYERNLNTGGNNYDESIGVAVENSVYHGSPHASHIVLPVLPD